MQFLVLMLNKKKIQNVFSFVDLFAVSSVTRSWISTKMISFPKTILALPGGMQETIWNTKASPARGAGVISQVRTLKYFRSFSGGFWAVVSAAAHGNLQGGTGRARPQPLRSTLPTDDC